MAASPSRLQPGQRMARAHRRAAESQQWDTRLQPARPPGSCNELLEQQLPPSVMLQQGTGSCVNQMYRDFQHAALLFVAGKCQQFSAAATRAGLLWQPARRIRPCHQAAQERQEGCLWCVVHNPEELFSWSPNI